MWNVEPVRRTSVDEQRTVGFIVVFHDAQRPKRVQWVLNAHGTNVALAMNLHVVFTF